MLTVARSQVNDGLMNQALHRQEIFDRSLESAVRLAVLPEIARRRPERILLVSPEPAAFPTLGAWPLVALRCGQDTDSDPVACDTVALPFQDDVFDAVLLHHVFADGREPELDEAWRVLSGGGDLFVLGQGSLGRPLRFYGRRRHWPGLRVRQVCQRLRQRAFVIEHCTGSGILGLGVRCVQRWQRPMLPFVDTVVIHGRHRPLKPIVRPLGFGRPQTVGVRSAAADSLFRKAV
jgi:SAM-dependent methyltransferase